MAYSTEVLADGPVGYWRLNETSGSTVVDSSGNGLNGTYINSPSLNQQSRVSGGASVLFNGTTQYASIAHNALLDVTHVNGLTVEIWANFVTATVGNNETIIGRGVATSPIEVPYRIYDESRNTQIEGGYFGDGAIRVAAISSQASGIWQHMAFTVEAIGSDRIVRSYLNGTLQNTSTSTSDVPARATGLFIGAENNRRFVNAYLAEAAIYPTALSSARLLAHYTAALTGSPRRRMMMMQRGGL